MSGDEDLNRCLSDIKEATIAIVDYEAQLASNLHFSMTDIPNKQAEQA